MHEQFRKKEARVFELRLESAKEECDETWRRFSSVETVRKGVEITGCRSGEQIYD
jgi:hypothetical protein